MQDVETRVTQALGPLIGTAQAQGGLRSLSSFSLPPARSYVVDRLNLR
jgi:hypothetical protein